MQQLCGLFSDRLPVAVVRRPALRHGGPGRPYQTHGTPFDKNFPTGASYLGAGGTEPTNRQAGLGLAPNGLSQSVVGVDIKEPIAPGGWAFVGRGELAFDPYSGLLANAPQALQDAIHVPLNTEALPVNSSRWGWLAAQIYAGVSSPVWGTLTFGRQNALQTGRVSMPTIRWAAHTLSRRSASLALPAAPAIPKNVAGPRRSNIVSISATSALRQWGSR